MTMDSDGTRFLLAAHEMEQTPTRSVAVVGDEIGDHLPKDAKHLRGGCITLAPGAQLTEPRLPTDDAVQNALLRFRPMLVGVGQQGMPCDEPQRCGHAASMQGMMMRHSQRWFVAYLPTQRGGAGAQVN